jgi:hypothetical protein
MIYPFLPLASLALGHLTTARRQADDVVALAKGISLVAALTCRARVEIAQATWKRPALTPVKRSTSAQIHMAT